jgi:peroxiredoxin
VAISYDSGEVLEQFAKKRGIQFPLLSDPGSTTIKAWKLLNADAKGNGEGIPHPMTYVIGRDGVIRAKLGHEAYKDRHTVQELIQSAKTVGQK